MKISYEFVTGELSEIEVDDALGGMLLDYDRQQYNNDHKETRRHVSLDGMEYEGAPFISEADTANEMERREDMARLFSAMKVLSPAQRELVEKVFLKSGKLRILPVKKGCPMWQSLIAWSGFTKKLKIIFNQTLTFCLSRGLTVRAVKISALRKR